MERCPECGERTYDSGSEIYCPHCGLVIRESIF